MASIFNAIVGALALLYGRQLFWLFVAVAGFVLGFNLASQFLDEQSTAILLVIGVVVGVIGAVLAVVAQRLAVGLAGFVAGGYLFLYLAQFFAVSVEGLLATILFIVGGIIGAVLVTAILDPALIFLSAALGATLLAQASETLFDINPSARMLIFVALLILGIAVQWTAWQRDEARQRYQTYDS